jgi:hypothetical protein
LIEALELQLARVNEKMAELADAKMLLARWLNKLTS